MRVLRQIAEKRMADRVRNVEIREELKGRRGARESETKSSEMERSLGSNGSREISKKSEWKGEGEEGGQGENGTIILSNDMFIKMLYI